MIVRYLFSPIVQNAADSDSFNDPITKRKIPSLFIWLNSFCSSHLFCLFQGKKKEKKRKKDQIKSKGDLRKHGVQVSNSTMEILSD